MIKRFSTFGYAISDGTGINVATVSPTARGAMVNWLMTVPQVLVTNNWTDDMIAEVFERMRILDPETHTFSPSKQAYLRKVRIEEIFE